MASKFKPRVCCWEDVSYANATILLDPEFPQEMMQNLLVQILGLPLNEDKQLDKRGLITLELFGYLVLFARENAFTAEQLSALYTIVASIHQLCLSTPYDNSQPCFQLLKDLLVCHSVNRPPYSTGLFSVEQVKSISDYVLESYFKHFKLYKYAFTNKVHMDLTFRYEGVADTPVSSQTELEPTDEAAGGERTDSEETDGVKDENVVEAGEGKDDQDDDQTQDKNVEDTPTQAEQQLRSLISSALSEQLKQLQMSVEKEIEASDKRISEKLSSLDPTGDLKSKKPK